MFTLLGKLLAFLNLAVAIALLAWTVSLYQHRPGWFDPLPEGDKGLAKKADDTPSFAELKQEIDTLGRAAAVASDSWGKQKAILVAAEERRAKRRAEFDKRIAWAKTGNKDKDGSAFFGPVYEVDPIDDTKTLSSLNINEIGPAILGPDKQPLKGANTLSAAVVKDAATIVELQGQIDKQYEEFDRLGNLIVAQEARLIKMTEIRESVQAELFYLSTFEVNVYETRSTVFRRHKQLTRRLTELGGLGGK
jgi:hypothetical protein